MYLADEIYEDVKNRPLYSDGSGKKTGFTIDDTENTIKDLMQKTEFDIKFILHEWHQAKAAYVVDPDFGKELLKTEKLKLYQDHLWHMPFPSWFMDTRQMACHDFPYYGVFVCAGREEKDKGLTLMLCLVTDKNSLTPYRLSLSNCDLKKKSYWEIDSIRFDSYEFNGKEKQLTDAEGFPSAVMLALQMISFLSCQNKDIEYVPDKRRNVLSVSRSDKNKEVQKWNAGFHIGNKIRIGKLTSQTRIGGSCPHGRPRAHVRSAHWTHVWCGPKAQGQHLETRWIEPVFVGVSSDKIPTVLHKVTDKDYSGSSGEELVADILNALGVTYIREECVEIKGHVRRFDFSVLSEGKKLYIEFDGEQHFHPVEQFGGENAFKELRKADKDKNAYARKQHIPLLRIRYDQKKEVEKLVTRFLKNPKIYKTI